VGDYILIEEFAFAGTEFGHNSLASFPASSSSTLDFGHSTTTSINFSQGYANLGLQLTKQPLAGGNLPVVPEPVSSVLFVTGGVLLTMRRLIKRQVI